MVGVAVNVTLVPAQIGLAGADPILTEGVTLAVTVTLMGLPGLVQPAALVTYNVPLNVVVVTTAGRLLIGIGEAGRGVDATLGGPDAQTIL